MSTVAQIGIVPSAIDTLFQNVILILAVITDVIVIGGAVLMGIVTGIVDRASAIGITDVILRAIATSGHILCTTFIAIVIAIGIAVRTSSNIFLATLVTLVVTVLIGIGAASNILCTAIITLVIVVAGLVEAVGHIGSAADVTVVIAIVTLVRALAQLISTNVTHVVIIVIATHSAHVLFTTSVVAEVVAGIHIDTLAGFLQAAGVVTVVIFVLVDTTVEGNSTNITNVVSRIYVDAIGQLIVFVLAVVAEMVLIAIVCVLTDKCGTTLIVTLVILILIFAIGDALLTIVTNVSAVLGFMRILANVPRGALCIIVTLVILVGILTLGNIVFQTFVTLVVAIVRSIVALFTGNGVTAVIAHVVCIGIAILVGICTSAPEITPSFCIARVVGQSAFIFIAVFTSTGIQATLVAQMVAIVRLIVVIAYIFCAAEITIVVTISGTIIVDVIVAQCPHLTCGVPEISTCSTRLCSGTVRITLVLQHSRFNSNAVVSNINIRLRSLIGHSGCTGFCFDLTGTINIGTTGSGIHIALRGIYITIDADRCIFFTAGSRIIVRIQTRSIGNGRIIQT